MKLRVRYLTVRPGAPGELPRYFWQPSSHLRAQGWRPLRVPENWRALGDHALEAAAIAAANARNAEVDAWRKGRGLTAPKPAARQTLKELIAIYRERGYPPSGRGRHKPKALAPKTVRNYKTWLPLLETWGGDRRVAELKHSHFIDLHEAFADSPAKAEAIIRMASRLMGVARDLDWITANPVEQLGISRAAGAGVVWPRAAVDAFVAAADRIGLPAIGTAILVNSWLAQREGDVLSLPRDVLDERGHVVDQSKTHARVALPIAAVPALVTRIRAELARHAGRNPAPTMLITRGDGFLPYRENPFRDDFARVRAAVAAKTPRFELDYLPPGRNEWFVETGGLKFAWLRHTGITRLAEAEATIPEIAAISGHSLSSVTKILEIYMARTARLARSAFAKRLWHDNLAI